jgi:sulfoxide reductase heme-binding subunit YedZ
MQPAYFQTYVTGPPGAPMPGWAGWLSTASIVAGYVVGLLLLVLVALSSNRSLRRLGPDRWKRVQRGSAWVLLLTVAHGVVFQVLEGRTGGWLAALVVVAAAIFTLRRRARRAVAAAAAAG